ncbi:MAG: ice-binding family protein [Burkholderiales bacterium]
MKRFNNFSRSKPLAWLMASLLALLVAGCGSSGGDAAPAATPATGTLGVSLTDAPACGFDAVNVTVVKVRAHQSSSAADTDAGWADITLNPARKINLLGLTNGVLDNLGETPLAAGHYTQLRLVLDPNTAVGLANSVVPTGGVETALVTPSAVQSGIKLINQLDVASGQRVDLVLDFDACKSVVKRGNGTYALKPVIKVVPFVLNGIEGFVDTALLSGHIMVTAQQNGTVIQTTVPNANGKFFLARLAPGNYDVVAHAHEHTTAVVAAVPVASTTSVVTLGSSATPITLPVSATHVVSGTAGLNLADSTTVVYVAAKQTFGTAPVVTVMSMAADELASGAYTLTLPVGPPSFSQYAAGWAPSALVAQNDMAGVYTIEASATGYQTQSAVKDLSAADVSQVFSPLGLSPSSLGAAGHFAILTKAGITDVPTSVITGNIGTSPISGAAIGVTCAEVAGTIYSADAAGPSCKLTDATLLTTAVANMETAYTDAAGRPAGVGAKLNVGAGTVADQTLVPGIYTWGSNVTITTDLALNGGANDVWIFQITGTLDMSSNMRVILSGGALAKNVIWQVADVVTLGTGSHFEGIVLAQKNIAMRTGASINGRLLAQTAVALQSNTVTQPIP